MSNDGGQPVVLVADGYHGYTVHLNQTIGGKTRDNDWKSEWSKGVK